jgi:hypothetical protein
MGYPDKNREVTQPRLNATGRDDAERNTTRYKKHNIRSHLRKFPRNLSRSLSHWRQVKGYPHWWKIRCGIDLKRKSNL